MSFQNVSKLEWILSGVEKILIIFGIPLLALAVVACIIHSVAQAVVHLFYKLPVFIQTCLLDIFTEVKDYPYLLFVYLGMHPAISGVFLAVILAIWVVIRHTLTYLSYYWNNGRVTLNDPSRSDLWDTPWHATSIRRTVEGRSNVRRFCKEHGIDLYYQRRIWESFIRAVTRW